MTEIQRELLALADEEYKNFHKRLVPTIDENLILGVRTPLLRNYAKEIFKTEKAKEFLKNPDHKYYEEKNLHAFLIERIGDYDECLFETERFLPFVDNWATCDGMRPKALFKKPDELIKKIKVWLSSNEIYTVRFAVELLMIGYLKENFKEEYLFLVSEIESDEYYVNMMRAWFFQEALFKRWDEAIVFFEEKRLDWFTHNKAISKASDSFRMTKEQKDYLKSLRIKNTDK